MRRGIRSLFHIHLNGLAWRDQAFPGKLAHDYKAALWRVILRYFEDLAGMERL
jgi:hypothetical protein